MIPARTAAAFCSLLIACAAARAAPQQAPQEPLPLNYQPAADSDEAGLWMMSERMEQSLQASPMLVRDSALNTYVKGVVCKLVPDRCGSIRIYILDVPYFNAAMAPNGAMQVWTGLLLRAQNEAQLAFILGHETSHYTLRHTIELWRRARSGSGFAAFFTIATGGLGAIVALAEMNSLLEHSRDEEREADAGGFSLAAAAGYDPAQNASLWRAQLAEEAATPKHDELFAFTKTHPATQERLATMEKAAAEREPTRTDWTVGTERYEQAVASFRRHWLEEDLALGHYEASLLLLNRLLAGEPNSGLLRFFLGEAYRRRNAAGDLPQAIEAYRAAAATSDAPAAVYRGLGLCLMKSGDKQGARDAFEKYLAAEPAADDRAMIDYYISHL